MLSLAVKKVRGQSEATRVISNEKLYQVAKAKKLNILLRILLLDNSLQGIFTTMTGFVTWPPYKR